MLKDLIPSRSNPPKRVIRAKRSYTANVPGQLSFHEGDFFYVTDENPTSLMYHVSDPSTNRHGIVPIELFEILERREDKVRRKSRASISHKRSTSSTNVRDSSVSAFLKTNTTRTSLHSQTDEDNPSSSAAAMAGESGVRRPVYRRPSIGRIKVEIPPTSGQTSANPSPFQGRARQVSNLITTRPRRDSNTTLFQVHGMVLYDFAAETEDELSVSKDEPIMVIAQSNDEWFLVKPMVRVAGPGLVPISFIELRDHLTGKAVSGLQDLRSRYSIHLPTVSEWKREMLAWGKSRGSSVFAPSPTTTSYSGPPSAKESSNINSAFPVPVSIPTPSSLSQSASNTSAQPITVATASSGAQSATTTAAPLQLNTSTAVASPYETSPTNGPVHRRTPSCNASHLSLLPSTLKQRGRAHTTSSTTSSIADRSSIRLCPKSRHDSVTSINRMPNEQLPPFSSSEVVGVQVTDVICKDGAYLYKVVIAFSSGNQRNIYRTYEDFCHAQTGIFELLSRSVHGAEIIEEFPKLHPPQSYVNDTISARRRSELDRYVQCLMGQPDQIVCCAPVQQLFGSNVNGASPLSRSPLSSCRSRDSASSSITLSTINTNTRAHTPDNEYHGDSRANSEMWADSELTTIETSRGSKTNSLTHESESISASPVDAVSNPNILTQSKQLKHAKGLISSGMIVEKPQSHQQQPRASITNTASNASSFIKVKLSIDDELVVFRLSKDTSFEALTNKIKQKVLETKKELHENTTIRCKYPGGELVVLKSDKDLMGAISSTTKLFLLVKTTSSPDGSPLNQPQISPLDSDTINLPETASATQIKAN
ncbi:bud emergence protein 1 [Mycoemilia scoparia]|uniref:Bud emergence protein 1 n=1 Tax=Mycoemilia scoparia TaxID=417184 RepID=A0A9W8DW29_9FUNG|nr:bud emergence protein 1 [Mycoemilia scoparia]